MQNKGLVYTSQAGENLAEAVVEKIMATLPEGSPLALAGIKIYVPSPRAGLALKEAFVKINGAGLLPHIHMMSFHDEDMDVHRFERNDLEKKEIISSLGRQMVLTQLVQTAYPSYSFNKCFEQATALSSLFSKLKAYDLTIQDVEKEIPENLSHHWKQNVNFFKIAFEFYPNWLHENQKVDTVDAAQKAVEVELDSLQKNGMKNAVWAVGFSDTTPLGFKLLKEIIKHEKGVLILSSLDKNMSDELFEQVPETHPQFTLKRLLQKLELQRSDVEYLKEKNTSERVLCWQQALAPAEGLKKIDEITALKGVQGLSYIEASTESEEAEVVALIMRETLEVEGKTCALISPDRRLSLRVEACLKKWGVNVDDSAGIPLLSTPLGRLFFMVVNLVNEYFPPLMLAEFLNHKYANLGHIENKKQKLKALDHLVLRGEKPASGFVGLRHKLQKSLQNERKDGNLAPDALTFMNELEAVFKPLLGKGAEYKVDFWISKHLDVLKTVLKQDEQDELNIFDDEAGQTLLGMLSSWQDAAKDVQNINLETYLGMLTGVMSTTAVRKKQSTHPRLFIWGPMESRLQHVDRVIVGALNEGVWPRKVAPDVWFNSSICEKLGIPSAQVHVGMSAHDLLNLVTQKEVFMTRTLKDSEGETIPSRFVSRLESVMPQQVFEQLLVKNSIWKNRVRALRLNGDVQRLSPPKPKPNIERRPSIWSASTARDIMQCPYKVYIRKVLKLEALEAYEESFSASLKGQLIHKVLESFFVEVAHMPPPFAGDKGNKKEVYNHLMLQAKVAFEAVEEKASKALGLKQMEKIADAFANKVVEDHLNGTVPLHIEKDANVLLESGVKLYAKADRIDQTKEGLVVIDYKTGAPPSPKDVLNGVEPQMAVESVILNRGGFERKVPVKALEYWHVSGKKGEGVKFQNAIGVKENLEEFTQIADDALNSITAEMHKGEKAYEAFPGGEAMEEKKGPCRYCEFAGLCRFKDWVSHVNKS